MAQREIKFRAWFVNYHDTGFLDDFDINQDGVVFINVFGEEEMYPVDSKNVILEQYTGLKDMNGIEIYEGDIVVDTDILEISEIKVMDGAWMLVNTHDLLSDYATDVKVIGNIHENPELLKAE